MNMHITLRLIVNCYNFITTTNEVPSFGWYHDNPVYDFKICQRSTKFQKPRKWQQTRMNLHFLSKAIMSIQQQWSNLC